MSGDIPRDEKDPASGASVPSPPAAPPPLPLPRAPVAIPPSPPLFDLALLGCAGGRPHQAVDPWDLALHLTELLRRHALLRQIEQGARPAFGLRLGDAKLRRQGIDQPARIGGVGLARRTRNGEQTGEQQESEGNNGQDSPK